MDEPLIGPLDPDPAVYETGRWRSPRRLARMFSGARRAQGLFDPDRGPSPVPGTVLLAAAADPAPTALTPLVQHTAPPREREHDIGLPEPAAPSCPGHERVIRELQREVRWLSAENWRLRQAQEKRDWNGSTTDAADAGRPSGTPGTPATG